VLYKKFCLEWNIIERKFSFQMSVLYLIGTLLCPLTLLWEPVCELIASHACTLEREEFWEPFCHWLNFAAHQTGTVS
jgi:hypothetical protein